MHKSELAALVARAVAEQPAVSTADPGLELSLAILRVLARRYGPSFVDEVRVEIDGKADRMEASQDAEDRANANEVRAVLDG